MKRVLPFGLLFCILASALVIMLLPKPTGATEAFSLRNGYHWGMSKDEATALSEAEGLVLNQFMSAASISSYDNVPVGNFEARSFTLLFNKTESSTSLFHCSYWFPFIEIDTPESETLRNNLYASLVSVYGEPTILSNDGLANNAEDLIARWLLSDTQIELTASKDYKSDKSEPTTMSFRITYSSLEALSEPDKAEAPTSTPLNNLGF